MAGGALVTLRLRLAIAFAAVVLIPLVAAAVVVAITVPATAREQTASRLRAEATSVTQRLADLCDRAALLARGVALDSGARAAADAVGDAVEQGKASFAVVRDQSGAVVAAAGATAPPERTGCTSAAAGTTYVVGSAQVRVGGAQPIARRAQVGFAVDSGLVTALLPTADLAVALVDERGVVAASDPAAAALARRTLGSAPRDDVRDVGEELVLQVPVGRALPWSVVAALDRPRQGALPWVLVVVVAVVGLVAWLIGRRLAAVTTEPIAELAGAASRIAEGDLEARVPVRARDEVGQLAVAFNAMTERLQGSFAELQASRDQLRRDLTRLGETLSSTHDLSRILGLILDTAMETVRARAGAVFLVSPSREDLYLKVGRGLEGRSATTSGRLAVGAGVVGGVGAGGEPVCGQVHDGVELHPSEPSADEVIAVPLRSSGRVVGVLALYDRSDRRFDAQDLDTIKTFAGQATVAVDNVLLHQEAQRLSVTDGLTGLSNYRAFQRQLAREVERASRFERPLGLLLLDIDLFKAVNDEHGHQVGDAVLVELARRVEAEVRDVDTVARYGGEELVVVLPETGPEGAARLAERICAAVRGMPFSAGDLRLSITVSIGAAALPIQARTAADLLRAADQAMYAAKAAGRDTWRAAEPLPAAEVGESDSDSPDPG